MSTEEGGPISEDPRRASAPPATRPGGTSGPAAPAAEPLITETMRRAAVVWLGELPGQPAGRSTPVWCAWLDNALYVVSGPGEQPAPGLAAACRCQVSARGDNGARIVTWPAVVSRVEPGGEEWERVVPHLVAKRLNLPVTDDTPARWAAECTLHRLAPAGAPVVELPAGTLAAEPAGSPAARRTGPPFRPHRTRR